MDTNDLSALAAIRNTARQIKEQKLNGYSKEQVSVYEKMHQLEFVSGHSIEELLRMFAAGYTLVPPDPMKMIFDQMLCEKLSKSATAHLNKVLSERAGKRVLR